MHNTVSFFCVSLLSSDLLQNCTLNYHDILQVYVVYFGEHSGEKTTREIEDDHHSYLLDVKGSKEEAKASLIYSYKNVINGFSALLTPDEATKLSGKCDVQMGWHYTCHFYKSSDFQCKNIKKNIRLGLGSSMIGLDLDFGLYIYIFLFAKIFYTRNGVIS